MSGKQSLKSAPDLLVTAGEFYLDLIFYDLERPPRLGEELKTGNFAFSCGGGAAITGAAAARLGRTVELATAWGDSPLDTAARNQLSSFGVGSERSRTIPGEISGLSVAVSTRQDRYFLTFPGANRRLEEFLLSEAGLHQLRGAGHVHFALAPARWEPYSGLVRTLAEDGVTTSWDLGWDPAAAASPAFRSLWRELSVLFLNEAEALSYSGAPDVDAALSHFSTGQNTVVVKCGRSGASAIAKTIRRRSPALSVDAVDSTGAGDAFNGGFLHRWMSSASLEESLAAGNVCGGLSTRSPGGVASLPGLDEFQTHMSEIRRRR